MLGRREFLRRGVLGVGALTLANVLAACKPSFPTPTPPPTGDPCIPEGPYGPLLPPDANGVRLPEGFTSRVVARGGQLVPGTSYEWHTNADGGACFDHPDGGWSYVSNSETGATLGGGASSLRFAADSSVVSAQRICGGTSFNCAGGPTPWGTWLSCEERSRGRVHECWPLGDRPAQARPAMGRFQHEAAACDPDGDTVYLTEDNLDGCFYRFRHAPADLSDGVLEVAEVGGDCFVTWHEVPDPSAASMPTRNQVPEASRFHRGEGAWFGLGYVFFTTTYDDRVWRYEPSTQELRIFYDVQASCNPVLTGVDNLTVSNEGDVFVCEDPGDLQIVMLGRFGEVAPFLQVVGHDGSELTGAAFTPHGDRIYFSSQRGEGAGVTFEVTGPFRDADPVGS